MQIQKAGDYSFSDCFTFSPNWYNQGSIAYSPTNNILLYSTNSLVYVYDVSLHKVFHQIQCRQILKQKNYSQQTIENAKANFLLLSQDRILIGMNDGILIVLNKQYQLISNINTKLKNISMIAQNNDHFIIIDQVGSCVKVNLNGQIQLKISTKNCRPKKILKMDNHWILFYQNGEILLYDQIFQNQIRRLQWFKTQSILSIDSESNKILILSRNNDELIITYCEFTYGHQFPVEHTKSIYQISKNVFRCSIMIDYPKKYQYKRQEMRKASLTIKWLDEISFLLSGKLGQIYQFKLKNCLGKNRLQLRPFSNIEEQVPYQVIPDSHHFQDIYAMYRFEDNLFTIGIDRNLTFWTISDNSIIFEYQTRFLASKVKSIFRSECEKNNCFLLMENSVIRSWDVQQHIKGQGLLNQYWKLGKKHKIQKISSCPYQQGIISILTSSDQVIIYDLHQQRIIRELKVSDDTRQIGFVNKNILKNICQFLQHQSYQINLEQKELFKRNFKQDCYLAIYDKNYITFYNLQTKKCQRLDKYFKDMNNLEFAQDFFNFLNMIVSVVKSLQTLTLYIFNGVKTIKQALPTEFATHKYYIRILNNNKILISLWKNKGINLFLLDILEQPTTITGYCQFNYYVNYTQLSGDGKRLLCYSNVNSTLQIWELNFLVDRIELVSKNIKAHQGYIICAGFFNNQYAISCSLDQTLKVWDCQNIPNRAPPKGNKTKKKKKKTKNNQTTKKNHQNQEQSSSQQIQMG